MVLQSMERKALQKVNLPKMASEMLDRNGYKGPEQ